MARKKPPTVAEVFANKGKYQYSMMRVTSWDELAAAQEAGIDMCSVPPELLVDPKFRDVAPSIFAIPGKGLWDNSGPTDDFLRWGFEMIKAGADAVYCAASFQTIRRMADEGIPVIGHVGLIPHTCTWTGGFKAVGKTAESAMQIWDKVKRYEDAYAFGMEIEVVPPDIAAEISKRTPLFMVSMGSGPTATAIICSLMTCSARTAGMCRSTPRSIAISPSNTTACSGSASPPSANSTTTCRPRPFQRPHKSSVRSRASSRSSRPCWPRTSAEADMNVALDPRMHRHLSLTELPRFAADMG